MLVARPGRGGKEELAGHLEVEDERATAFELDEEHLPSTAGAENPAAHQRIKPLPSAPPKQGLVEEIDPGDEASPDPGSERPGDRFDFGEFGHGGMLLDFTP